MKTPLLISIAMVFLVCHGYSEDFDASEVDTYPVLKVGSQKIEIDASFNDWVLADKTLVMGEDTWEEFGGDWDGDEDLTAYLKVVYDEENLYFALQVKDDEYVPGGANPWDNDGIQMAIDASAGKMPAGWPNATTHLYNFSIQNGWMGETGPFLGDAIIEMDRDEGKKETLFEWQMPAEIFADSKTELTPGMEIAFAIIINDSDEDAPGQKGWVGWGNHTIVHGKNPEEMQTLVLDRNTMPVTPRDRATILWADIK
jgi:hypothetical protein